MTPQERNILGTLNLLVLSAEPDENRILLSEVISNATMLDRNIVEISYRSPYNMAMVSKAICLPRDGASMFLVGECYN